MEHGFQQSYGIRGSMNSCWTISSSNNPEGWCYRAMNHSFTRITASFRHCRPRWGWIALLCILLVLAGVSRLRGATTEITSTTGTGMPCSSRCIVRSASGNIYAVLDDVSSYPMNTVKVFESTDGGSTWAEQDAADAPTGVYYGVSAAIDGNGIIHIAYWDDTSTTTGLRYVTFSTITNTFSGDTAVVSVTSAQPQSRQTAIAIDSNNYVHVIYNDDVNGSLVVTYIDNVGGSWNTPVQLYSEAEGYFTGAEDILIDENNLPEIAYWDDNTSFKVYAAIGSANKATSFTSQLIASSDWLGGGSITMDSLGNTWIAYHSYFNSPYSPTIIEHKAGDPWSTWQPPIVDPDPLAQNAGYASIATIGTTLYVTWYKDSPYNLAAWQAYDGSAWSTVATFDQMGSPMIIGWSEYFNNSGTSQHDVIIPTGNSVYWTELNAAIFNASPSCASPGMPVNINGSGFGDTQGTSTVTFNGTPGTVTSWSNTAIVADVPSNVTSGPMVVNVGFGVSNPFTFAAPSTAQPIISSVTPDLSNIGGTITIKGQNLCTASVTFNSTAASPTSWNGDQQIVAPVPNGATTGPVIATVNSLSSNPFMFTVLGALDGTVTSTGNGGAISGATVQVLQSNNVIGSATTASDGTYSIMNLVPGTYDVRFYATGFGSAVVNGSVVGSGTVATVNGSLGSPGTISGKVTETDGATPIVGVSVTAAQGSNSLGSSTTDSNGDYSIATLSPGTYSVIAAETGFETEISSGITVTAGNSTTANFSLPAQASSGITYSYDGLGRLTGASISPGNTAIYNYDAVGNLLSIGQMAISGFSPGSGSVGTTVTITGTNFSATASQDTVVFNGTSASITSASTTQIVTTVPNGASTGPITVTAPGGSATSSTSFTVIPVAITGFTPTSGKVGTSVTITGTGFSATPSQDSIYFNGTSASITSASATQIITAVPRGATTGPITVYAPGGAATSSSSFTVTKH